MRLTDEQIKAIESTKRNIVVSASAGSGKTGTMVLRVVDLVKKGVSLDRIAMLTYTENAAHEMISRLSDVLLKGACEAAKEDKGKFVAALDALPMLSCGTIHSFCFKLIMAHFEKLGLSPLYTIADETMANALRTRVFRSVLQAMHEELGDEFLDFLEEFDAKGETTNLYESVKSVYECAVALEDGIAYLSKWEKIASTDIDKMPAVPFFLSEMQNRRDRLRNEYDALKQEASCAGANLFVATIDCRLTSLNNIEFDNLEKFFASLFIKYKADSYKPEDKLFPEIESKYKLLENKRKKFFSIKDWTDGKSMTDLRDFYHKAYSSVKVLLAFVSRFEENYRKVKEERKLLDFADLEKYALRLLKDDEIRRGIPFDYVLVDEKQDVNPLQDTLINLLSDGHDLFSVGDMKQSIFRFRQSAPEIFLDAMRKGDADREGSDVILFDKNFRSSRSVIRFVNSVFKPLMTESFGGVDYSQATLKGRDIVPVDPNKKKKIVCEGYVDCFFYTPLPVEKKIVEKPFDIREEDRLLKEAERKVSTEAEWVCKRIQEIVGTKLYDAKAQESFKVSYKDIAILCRSRSDVSKQVIESLRAAHIPMNLISFKKDEKAMETDQLTDLMRLILSSHNDYALVSVLRSPMFEFDVEELARVSLSEGKTYYEKAMKYAESEEGGKMREFFSYLKQIRFDSSVFPIAELLSKVVEERFRVSLLKEADGRLRFGGLRAFVDLMRTKRDITSVAGYLDYYDNEYRGIKGGEIEAGDAVTFMTIHGSKGLEFPVVFLIDTGSFMFSKKDSDKPVSVDKELGVHKRVVELNGIVSDSLAYKIAETKKRHDAMEDVLRLLYVALTRARNVLFVSGKVDSGRFGTILSPEEATSMADWLTYSLKGAVPHENAQSEIALLEVEDKSEDVKKGEAKEIRREVEGAETDPELLRRAFAYCYPYEIATQTGIKYTVTGINNMDNEEYHQPKLLFPEEKKEKGTAFHSVMENVSFTLSNEEETAAALDRLVEERVIEADERTNISVSAVLGALKKIRDLIGDRKAEREKTFMLRVPATEIGITGVSDDVIIQGKIDLLARNEEEAIIVDYKLTSAPDEVLRDRYRAQLALYALAVKKGLGVSRVRTYIFVLGRNRLIEILP